MLFDGFLKMIPLLIGEFKKLFPFNGNPNKSGNIPTFVSCPLPELLRNCKSPVIPIDQAPLVIPVIEPAE